MIAPPAIAIGVFHAARDHGVMNGKTWSQVIMFA